MDDSLTGMTCDEVQMMGASAYIDGLPLSDNPYKASNYDIPKGDPHGMKNAIKEARIAWKVGYMAMKMETQRRVGS